MSEQLHGPWDAENWRKAPGVIASEHETNGALARRDYSRPCSTVSIGVVCGYHLWWCSTHHQPHPWCERASTERSALQIARDAIRGLKALKDTPCE